MPTTQTQFQFKPYKHKDEEFLSPSNAERAECAEKALVTFAAAANDRSEDTESLVKDLVTDLGHYCDREGLDFEDIVRSAINTHWLEER